MGLILSLRDNSLTGETFPSYNSIFTDYNLLFNNNAPRPERVGALKVVWLNRIIELFLSFFYRNPIVLYSWHIRSFHLLGVQTTLNP